MVKCWYSLLEFFFVFKIITQWQLSRTNKVSSYYRWWMYYSFQFGWENEKMHVLLCELAVYMRLCFIDTMVDMDLIFLRWCIIDHTVLFFGHYNIPNGTHKKIAFLSFKIWPQLNGKYEKTKHWFGCIIMVHIIWCQHASCLRKAISYYFKNKLK